MNLYNDHLSYIKDFKVYAHKYECPSCSMHFKKVVDYKRHINTCTNRTKLKYSGGFFSSDKTIFEELEEYGIIVPPSDRQYEWYSVFDFEALLERVFDNPTEKLSWQQKHCPVSVSVCSNVVDNTDLSQPNFLKPICFIQKDLNKLLTDLFEYLDRIQKLSSTLAKRRWGAAMTSLDSLCEKWKPEEISTSLERTAESDEMGEGSDMDLNSDDSDADFILGKDGEDEDDDDDGDGDDSYDDDDDDDDDNDDNDDDDDDDDDSDEHYEDHGQHGDAVCQESVKSSSANSSHVKDAHRSSRVIMYNKLSQIRRRLDSYINQLPILGFNSSSYDINLIKSKLFSFLKFGEKEEHDNSYVIKRNNAYLSISNSKFKFIDILQFLAPGCNYEKFLKAYNTEETKGFFPYDFFDDIKKLDLTQLPAHKDFYSHLKQSNISEEQYESLKDVWVENKMVTFRDFLIWYNNKDAAPFVQAVNKMQQFYFEKGVDVFKVAISVPGIARKLLFKSCKETQTHFELIGPAHDDLYRTIRSNIVGGPSIIFHRHHKAGETIIREGDNSISDKKLCQKIVGYDSNALYLWALGRDLPTGAFVRRAASTGFKTERQSRYHSMYEWLNWKASTEGIEIKHKLNSPTEIRVGPYLVDGFCSFNNTAYEFHGCFFHVFSC